jgi:hypothetical protein
LQEAYELDRLRNQRQMRLSIMEEKFLAKQSMELQATLRRPCPLRASVGE